MTKLEKITIRSAVLDDLLTMIKLMNDVLESPSTEDDVQKLLDRWLPRFVKDSRFYYYVVENENMNMIGWCCGRETLECTRTVNDQIYDCEIGQIFILQQYQHRGIGRELWKIVWNSVLERFHPRNFLVWALDKESTHQFYRSLGGTRAGAKKTDDTILTAYIWNDPKPYDTTNFIIFI
ncbi:unnamed protein product [Adineta steineri]|uniref:N-acetyltransferase domain-containing protein n=1 Tax=Adineta steineri TaxID=433720 RepID=A0A814MH07_9BILA|nr:unnamed protein product [Adineta steineri]CAF1077817.1 unnamed protein product [Adineta steineri]